jgi:hypothetical protein
MKPISTKVWGRRRIKSYPIERCYYWLRLGLRFLRIGRKIILRSRVASAFGNR